MTDSIPSMALSILIPRCSVVYDSTVKIDRIEADMDIALPGNIDSMTVTVNALRLGGMGADITVNGVVGSLTTDPAFTGKVTFGEPSCQTAAAIACYASRLYGGRRDSAS